MSQILVNKASGDSVLQVLGNKARKNCQIIPALHFNSDLFGSKNHVWGHFWVTWGESPLHTQFKNILVGICNLSLLFLWWCHFFFILGLRLVFGLVVVVSRTLIYAFMTLCKSCYVLGTFGSRSHFWGRFWVTRGASPLYISNSRTFWSASVTSSVTINDSKKFSVATQMSFSAVVVGACCRHTVPDLTVKTEVKDRTAKCLLSQCVLGFWSLSNHDCMPWNQGKTSTRSQTDLETVSLPVAKILSPVARLSPLFAHPLFESAQWMAVGTASKNITDHYKLCQEQSKLIA